MTPPQPDHHLYDDDDPQSRLQPDQRHLRRDDPEVVLQAPASQEEQAAEEQAGLYEKSVLNALKEQATSA
ncbi:hypothetical protein CEK25_004165 [Fusarium fujikuroi]|nr:hypothetical protein CEK25_004165 [Fusarium fujikuroi]